MLRTILRAVAIVDGLVCLYALIQACALTVKERRGRSAVLRASGAGVRAVRALLAGAALALVPAAVVGILLERLLLGPALPLAASYATCRSRPARRDAASSPGWRCGRIAVRVGGAAGDAGDGRAEARLRA